MTVQKDDIPKISNIRISYSVDLLSIKINTGQINNDERNLFSLKLKKNIYVWLIYAVNFKSESPNDIYYFIKHFKVCLEGQSVDFLDF